MLNYPILTPAPIPECCTRCKSTQWETSDVPNRLKCLNCEADYVPKSRKG